MAKKIWNVAIVGPGWVATAYAESFRKRDDIRVTHVVGRTLRSANRFAETLDLDCARHGNLEAALQDKTLDIVGVFTPNHLHAEQTIAAAKARKHVIIEKPVCLSPGQLRAMRSAVKAAKVKTIVGFVLRWNPLLRMIRNHVESGRLGKLIHTETDYLHGIVGKTYTKAWHKTKRTAGTSLLLAGCHAVDTIRFLVGKPVVDVSAISTGRTRHLDYPSTEVALLRFADGTAGKVTCCLECNMPYVFNVEVFGTKGTFRNNQLAGDLLEGQTGFATIPTILPDSGDVAHHPFDGLVDHFIDCLNRRRRPLPDLEDAAETMEICFAAERSAKTGKRLKLPF